MDLGESLFNVLENLVYFKCGEKIEEEVCYGRRFVIRIQMVLVNEDVCLRSVHNEILHKLWEKI